MTAISADDPLWAVRGLAGRLPDDDPLLRKARDLIDSGPCEILAPEVLAGAREKLHLLLDSSPDQAAAASYVIQGFEGGELVQLHRKVRDGFIYFRRGTSYGPLSPPRPPPDTALPAEGSPLAGPSDAPNAPTSALPQRIAHITAEASPSRRSSTFSRWVTANGFCRVTGRPGGHDNGALVAAHILPFMHRQQHTPQSVNFLDLLRALFGAEAVAALVHNVLKAGDAGGRRIDRRDNGIALRPDVHDDWDRNLFSLEVDWTTLNMETAEFTCHFRQHGRQSFTNYWLPPIMSPRGGETYETLRDGDEIPVRRAEPVGGRELPLPSPFLLHVREVVGRIAHMMGAGEWLDLDDSESDGWDDPVAMAVPAHALFPVEGSAKDGGVGDWLESLATDDDMASSSAASHSGDVAIASA
ncbi:MAG: hypothetical protein M1832_000625 [Thelocarpon impressellum]|nr:MAG: hypothetical protein M1832_000625 [Thelocarpon impressellum]